MRHLFPCPSSSVSSRIIAFSILSLVISSSCGGDLDAVDEAGDVPIDAGNRHDRSSARCDDCDTHDDCSPNPCMNGGLCDDVGDTFSCACQRGFEGETCETPVDCGAPVSPPNGSVTNDGTTYGSTARYACDPGYMIVGASTRTCMANGTWSGPAPTCVPVPGVCNPNPCMNEGMCSETGPSSYVCTCAPGFVGEHCETPIAVGCVPNMCRNGGRCVTQGSRFRCICPRGFTGMFCTIRTLPGTWR